MSQPSKNIWNTRLLQNPHAAPDKASRVQAMFSAIAPRYDLLNRILSLGQDQRWRRHAVAALDPKPHERVLDLCCGSGDLTLALAHAQPHLDLLIGADFALPMLRLAQVKTDRARRKPLPLNWLCADAARLPFPPNSFHALSVAFGIRNLAQPQAALNHLAQLLKPAGRIVILEFDLPANPILRAAANAYFRLVLPALGSIMAHDRTRAYHYLPESVRTFDTANKITNCLLNAGFADIQIERLCAGAVLCCHARKP